MLKLEPEKYPWHVEAKDPGREPDYREGEYNKVWFTELVYQGEPGDCFLKLRDRYGKLCWFNGYIYGHENAQQAYETWLMLKLTNEMITS